MSEFTETEMSDNEEKNVSKSTVELSKIIKSDSEISQIVGAIFEQPLVQSLIQSFNDLIKSDSRTKEITLQNNQIELKKKEIGAQEQSNEHLFISGADKRQKVFILIFFILIVGVAVLNHYVNILPTEIINYMLTSLFGVIIYAFINLDRLKKTK